MGQRGVHTEWRVDLWALTTLACAYPVAAQAGSTHSLFYEQALDLGTFGPPRDVFMFRW